MNYLFIGVVIVLVGGFALGLKNGVVKMAISLAVSIVSIILTIIISPIVFKLLTEKKVTEAAAFAITLIGLFIILKIVTYIVEAMAEFPIISIVNRLIGGVVGLLGALVFVWIVFAIIMVIKDLSTGKMLYNLIEKNYYLELIWDSNPILKFLK
ncbi:MAG: CvpA family protein [Lachnospiraceae bacterium]|jgi:uncharacterized membrane protein required for colicin V production|nr:CvpA family protein [Lachnospiraceae bacterium]